MTLIWFLFWLGNNFPLYGFYDNGKLGVWGISLIVCLIIDFLNNTK